MKKTYDYDVIIVGAGISGLVCGCYLARAGVKTLLVERNPNPGGYCTSFNRNGHRFDACVHSLGSMGRDGNLKRILDELGVEVSMRRYLPSDIFITPDFKVSFGGSIDESIEDFQRCFPGERKGIGKFFSGIANMDKKESVNLRNKTFRHLLDFYFKDARLKSVLSFPVLGNMGLPASRATAFSAVKLYREFMLDGGYYPADGMGVFAGSIMDRFVSSGGKMMLSCEARKILFKDGLAEGVLLDNGSTVTAGHIISGCDLMHTIYDLIGKDRIPKAGLDDIRKLKNTLSTFIVYLAEKKDNGGRLDAGLSEGSNTWVLPSYDVDKLYRNAAARQASNISEYMIHVFPGKRTATVFINCDFKDKKFWASNKKDFASALMDKVAARLDRKSVV